MFYVNWKPNAEDQLAEICVSFDGAGRWVSGILDFFEKQVALRPFEFGESREGAARIVIIEELSIHYDVILDDKRLDVLAVARIR